MTTSLQLKNQPKISSDLQNLEYAVAALGLSPVDEGEEFVQLPYLYKISSLYTEDYEPGFAPVPTSASELPELNTWSKRFVIGVLEIWAGKRPAAQLARWCHPKIYEELMASTSYQREVGRIRKLHIQEPLDGLCECIATIQFKKRVRSMALRFEGVDHKWLCTDLQLI